MGGAGRSAGGNGRSSLPEEAVAAARSAASGLPLSGRGATPRFRVAGSIGDGGRGELCSFPLLRTRWNWEAEAPDLGKPHSRWDGSLLGTNLEFLAWRKQVGSLCWRLKHWLYILSFENLNLVRLHWDRVQPDVPEEFLLATIVCLALDTMFCWHKDGSLILIVKIGLGES